MVDTPGETRQEQEVAWLLWQVKHGSLKTEDRAIGTN